MNFDCLLISYKCGSIFNLHVSTEVNFQDITFGSTPVLRAV